MNEQLERLLSVLAAQDRANLSLEERRRQFDEADRILGSEVPPLEMEAEIDDGPLSAVLRVPRGPSRDGLIVYLHGGGFAEGSPKSHRGLTIRLGAAANLPIIVPDYPLSPENPYPIAVEDCVEFIVWAASSPPCLEEFGPDLVLAGESAGGNLVVNCLARIRDESPSSFKRIKGGLAMSGWFDLRNDALAYDELDGRDPVLTKAQVDEYANWYLGGADPADPGISPVNADLSGLPPIRIDFGTEEVLRDDSATLAARARDAGVEVTSVEWSGMTHAFQLFAQFVDEAERAVNEGGKFLRDCLGSPT